ARLLRVEERGLGEREEHVGREAGGVPPQLADDGIRRFVETHVQSAAAEGLLAERAQPAGRQHAAREGAVDVLRAAMDDAHGRRTRRREEEHTEQRNAAQYLN